MLGSRDYREADRIYTLFSKEEGLISVLAKGVRKPSARLSGVLESPLICEVFLVVGRRINRAAGSLVIDYLKNIRKDYEKMILVRKVFKVLIELLSKEEAAPLLFDQLVFFLSYLDKTDQTNSHSLVASGVIWQIVIQSGLSPELYHCLNCQEKLKESDGRFFLSMEGFFCQHCFSKMTPRIKAIKLSSEAVKLLRVLAVKKLETVIKIKISVNVSKELEQAVQLLASKENFT